MRNEERRKLVAWIFEGRCATCHHRWPLEKHHNVYPARPDEERPGDEVPLCSLCHAVVTWRRSPAFDEFVQRIKAATKKDQRLRIVTREISEAAMVYMKEIFRHLAEAEEKLRHVMAMENAWDEWNDLPKKFGRDALQAMDDREERDTWGDERRAA